MSYFTPEELACTHCGKQNFNEEVLATLNQMREEAGFPFVVSSAYRCPEHPIEAKKANLGEHTTGMAVDILVSGEQAHTLLSLAAAYGVPRIGVNQKGARANRFIHLGFNEDYPNPTVWSYS